MIYIRQLKFDRKDSYLTSDLRLKILIKKEILLLKRAQFFLFLLTSHLCQPHQHPYPN